MLSPTNLHANTSGFNSSVLLTNAVIICLTVDLDSMLYSKTRAGKIGEDTETRTLEWLNIWQKWKQTCFIQDIEFATTRSEKYYFISSYFKQTAVIQQREAVHGQPSLTWFDPASRTHTSFESCKRYLIACSRKRLLVVNWKQVWKCVSNRNFMAKLLSK